MTGTHRRRTLAGTAVLLLLAGTALFDRAFGVIGVPGVPIYISEMVLALGLLSLVLTPRPFVQLLRDRWLAPFILVVFGLWAIVRLATSLSNPVLEVLRDSAVVYYALFAAVVVALARRDRRFQPAELLRLYGRFVPVLLVVLPIRLAFVSIGALSDLGPVMPGSELKFVSAHRLGNLAVHAAVAVVYLATTQKRTKRTMVGITTGLLVIIVAGTQNRGGLLAAGAIIIVAMLVGRRAVKFRWVAVCVLAVGLGIVAWGVDLRVQTDSREISVGQLVQNVQTAVGIAPQGHSTQQLEATIDFRTELWTKVYDATRHEDRMENGWGFGVNLGSAFLPQHDDPGLRNPHNSHLTILFRLGLVGMALWCAFWFSWLRRVGHVAASLRRRRGDPNARLALLATVAVVGMLVNAFLDPSLEGPAVGVWLWCVVGFGMVAATSPRPADPSHADPSPADGRSADPRSSDALSLDPSQAEALPPA